MLWISLKHLRNLVLARTLVPLTFYPYLSPCKLASLWAWHSLLYLLTSEIVLRYLFVFAIVFPDDTFSDSSLLDWQSQNLSFLSISFPFFVWNIWFSALTFSSQKPSAVSNGEIPPSWILNSNLNRTNTFCLR
jgi:hypothetical protein